MLISFSLSLPDVMKIDARALYDYTARSDKELTFSRGDMLYVVSKTPDHNWWDGFHQGKRGYIPVAYVEIIQLDSVAVPEPPERKSSIPLEQVIEDKVQTPKASEPPAEATIFEVEEAETRVKPTPEQEDRLVQEEKKEEEEDEEGRRLKEDEERKTKDEEKTKVEDDKAARMEDGKKVEEGEEKKEVKPPVKVEIKPPETTTETRTPKRHAPVRGSVKTLTQQFQEPPPTQQRVLMEPHSTHHRRQNSDTTGWKAEQSEALSTRSASGGSKVSMLSSTFEMKSRSGPPPPLKPKPQMHSPVTPDPTSPSAFPIVSHSTIPSASPLQRAAMVGQMSQSSPSAAVKKPPAPSKPRGSLKVKRERSTKRDEKRDEKPPKPMKPPLPTQGFIPPPHSATPQARSQALHEEIQAAAAARRKATENLK